MLLRDAIDWSRFERAFAPAYSDGNGRPSIPVRMMGEFFEHEPPADQATMSRWRSRAGEAGAKEMVMATLASAVRDRVAKRRDFERVNVDTTVEERRWLMRLFLCLQAAADGFAACIARPVRLAVAELARLAELPRSLSAYPDWGFA